MSANGSGYDVDREVPSSPRLVEMAPWVVVGAGVGAMIFLFVAATAGLPTAQSADSTPGPILSPVWPFVPDAGQSVGNGEFAPGPTAAATAPPLAAPTSDPATPPPATPRPGAGAPAPSAPRPGASAPSAPRTTAVAAPAPAPPQRVDVTGRYRVMESFHDSFIGEVLVTNDGRAARQWTVELRFPGNVGGLRTSWVESAPQATLRRSGERYFWTSSVPVGAGSAVPLRFHFDRSGGGDTPSECRTNGGRCAV